MIKKGYDRIGISVFGLVAFAFCLFITASAYADEKGRNCGGPCVPVEVPNPNPEPGNGDFVCDTDGCVTDDSDEAHPTNPTNNGRDR